MLPAGCVIKKNPGECCGKPDCSGMTGSGTGTGKYQTNECTPLTKIEILKRTKRGVPSGERFLTTLITKKKKKKKVDTVLCFQTKPARQINIRCCIAGTGTGGTGTGTGTGTSGTGTTFVNGTGSGSTGTQTGQLKSRVIIEHTREYEKNGAKRTCMPLM